ncbi:hypothetical protein I7G86_13920 [Sinorhizobium meliloti]|uniref:hypothetical protein n=1 Tax=Rhizobium meliloti TaxID=382 RepID=UPI0002E73DF3|nr:hypothetical protein [Sinorhizobium meliloti]MDE3791731.1 hypothetical protein [Sinorhizobium meliloti]
MTSNPRVNRYLKDKAMDHIDHALGRPVDPLGETYRNHFATDAGGKQAQQFAASPNWERVGQRDDMAFFAVTDIGRDALAAHLKQIGDKHRLYHVTYEGQTQAVVAVSAAKAKYSLWLDISDCFCDLTFGKFCRAATVRAAA